MDDEIKKYFEPKIAKLKETQMQKECHLLDELLEILSTIASSSHS